MVTVLRSGPGYLFALWTNLYILDFQGTPTVEALRATIETKPVAEQLSPGGLAVINFLAPGPLPSAEVRQVASEVQTRAQTGVLCHATVVEATGIAASALRSVLHGLSAAQRSPFPRKVFGDVDDALAWQAHVLRVEPRWVHDARVAVDEVRVRRA